ncbi:MAG: hypothetical protein AAGI17_08985 [Planctomycetota bacterium]
MKTSIAMISALAISAGAAQAQLEQNGNFEAGDTSGWVYFPSLDGNGTSVFNVTGDASEGSFAGFVSNSDLASSAVIKQANLGAGQLSAGQTITVSFDAKGSAANGGVVFAEFFEEILPEGVSNGQIITGGPLALTDQYQSFSFDITLSGDTANFNNGITLQFAVVTGGAAGSFSELFVDNVQITPAPGAAAAFGLAGLAATRRRRSA